MERLKQRAFALAAIFVVAGLAAHVATPASSAVHNEPWMERSSLTSVGQYQMVPGTDPDRSVSYKMDKPTYEALNPAGIVCRDFTDGRSVFDVVLVASQAKDSFHDPRVCFTAQGWQLDNETDAVLPTNRGPFPVTIAQIKSEDGTRWAAFGYRTPYGFAGSTNQLKLQMFSYSLLTSKNGEGVFYRFIGMSPDVTRQSLLRFIQTYMNASTNFSKGYF